MNTTVYIQSASMFYKSKGWVASTLTVASIFLLLSTLLSGCGQEAEDDEEIDELTSKSIPEQIRKSKQPSIEDVFGGTRSAEASDSSSTSDAKMETFRKIELLIDNSEWNPKLLNEAERLLKILRSTLDSVSSEGCKKDVNNPDFLLGPCNQHAIIYAKIAEVYYFKAEVVEPADAHQEKLEFYVRGIGFANKAKEYNEHNVAVQLWYANNKGGWLSMMDAMYPSMLWDKSRLSDDEVAELKKTPKQIINGLSIANALDRKSDRPYDNGAIYLALGRALHKLPTEYAGFETKESKLREAIKYLRRANDIAEKEITKSDNPYSHKGNKLQLPKFFLFDLYQDNENGVSNSSRANEYAQKVKIAIHKKIKIGAKTKKFKQKYPLTYHRQMDAISAFDNQNGH